MQYNCDFEIAAMLFMTIILLHFAFIRPLQGNGAKVFGMLTLTGMAACGVNILSCSGLANAKFVPSGVNELLAFVFFASEGVWLYLMFYYFMLILRRNIGIKLLRILGMFPLLLFSAVLCGNLFNGYLYQFKEGIYQKGPGAYWFLLYAIYYFGMSAALICSSSLRVTYKILLLTNEAAAALVFGIQYQSGKTLPGTFGNVMILLLIGLTCPHQKMLADTANGLENENALLLQMKELIAHQKHLSVIMLDIRHIHKVEPMMGDVCNSFLQEVKQYLSHLCKESQVFYLSGEMLGVLVESGDKCAQILEKINKRCEKEWDIGKNHAVFVPSAVVMHYPKDFKTVSEYLGMRDLILEEVNRFKAQAVFISGEELRQKYDRRLKVKRAVSRAVQEKRFEVYYQPIYSLTEERIVSLEALVRMQDKELGMIPPEEFIPLAERDGNIITISTLVLEACCRFLSRHVLPAASLGIRSIHVNLSAVSCMQENLAGTILPVLKKYHIPPSMITFEISENTAAAETEPMRMQREELKNAGITFSMDHYGSGSTGLTYLKRFPFQEIKIRKECVWAYFENESDKILLENEIKTIQQFKIPLVVEGIEKKEQSEAMERLGVDYIQGYYYGPPMPQQECLRFIRNFSSAPEDYGRV